MKFVTKQETVEAFQYKIDEIPEWAQGKIEATETQIEKGTYVVKREAGVKLYEPKEFHKNFQSIW